MLASKFFDDVYYNNAYYARVGGISNAEVLAHALSACSVHVPALVTFLCTAGELTRDGDASHDFLLAFRAAGPVRALPLFGAVRGPEWGLIFLSGRLICLVRFDIRRARSPRSCILTWQLLVSLSVSTQVPHLLYLLRRLLLPAAFVARPHNLASLIAAAPTPLASRPLRATPLVSQLVVAR